MAAASQPVVDLGGTSSRSTSPESDDIDIDAEGGDDYVPQASESSRASKMTSPRSREGPYSRSSGGGITAQAGNARQQAARSSNGTQAAAGKRRTREGKDTNQQQRTRNATNGGGGGDDFEEFGGLERDFPGTATRGPGAAYDRLLDLDYARDFGDPFARFDAGLQQQATRPTPAAAAVISPTMTTSATMQSASSTDSLPPPVANEAPASTEAKKDGEEKMETDS